jgi:hypothetical protein
MRVDNDFGWVDDDGVEYPINAEEDGRPIHRTETIRAKKVSVR